MDSEAQHFTRDHIGAQHGLFLRRIVALDAACQPFPSPLPPRHPATRRSLSRSIPPLAGPQLHYSGEEPTGRVVDSHPTPVSFICAAGRWRVRVLSCVSSAVRARGAALVCGLWDVLISELRVVVPR